MTELTAPWPAERPPARPFQLALRAAVPVSALGAVVAARAAAGDPLIVLEVAIVALAAWCGVTPDSHVGLLAVVLIGVNWLVAVDDHTSVWALGAAGSVAVLHTAMSAASLAPAAARWTSAMRRRWGRRCLTQIVVVLPTWLLVVAVSRVEIDGSALVMTGALVAVAVSALWAGGAGRGDRADV